MSSIAVPAAAPRPRWRRALRPGALAIAAGGMALAITCAAVLGRGGVAGYDAFEVGA